MIGAELLSLLYGDPLDKLGAAINPNPQLQPQGGPPAAADGSQAVSPAGTQGGPPAAAPQQQNMGQLLADIYRRGRSADEIDRGTALMASAFGTAQQQHDLMNYATATPESHPELLVGQALKAQQELTEQQEHARFIAGAGGLSNLFPNLTPGQVTTLANNPEAFNEALRTAVGGSPAWMAQKRAEAAYDARGEPIPWARGDPASYDAFVKNQTTTTVDKAKDLVADQHNFAPALQNYDKTIGLIDQFSTPEMQKAAQEFLGTGGALRPVATMSDAGKNAWSLYRQIMATQFAAGTQDFKGAGRITQSELNQDAPSQSTMGQLNQAPGDFYAGVGRYRDQLAQHRANLFGVAQKGDDPRLSDEDYALYVRPNLDVLGGPKRNLPDFSKMNDNDATAAITNLPSGQVFIGPDGQPHKKK